MTAPIMLTLRTHDGQAVQYPQPKARATFNQTSGPVRRLLAAKLTPGIVMACADNTGRRLACRVHRVRKVGTGTVFAWVETLHATTGGRRCGYVQFLAGEPISVLPTHYGICCVCGALSPCADELTQRAAEQISAACGGLIELSAELMATQGKPSWPI